MDLDIDGPGFRQPARATPPPVDGVDGHLARGGQDPGQAAELGRGRQRAVKEQDVAGPVAERAVRDVGAVGSLDPMVSWNDGIETGTKVGPSELAVRRPGQGVDPDERGRHLEPGEAVPAEGGQGRVTGVRGARAKDDGRDGHVPELRVATGDDAGIGDGRVVEEDSLDLRRGDVLATTDDPVGAAVGDGQPGPRRRGSRGHRSAASRRPSSRQLVAASSPR